MGRGGKMQVRHAAHISVRASPVLLNALAKRADEVGCSTSEYLRSIIRERVGLN